MIGNKGLTIGQLLERGFISSPDTAVKEALDNASFVGVLVCGHVVDRMVSASRTGAQRVAEVGHSTLEFTRALFNPPGGVS